ncbi:MAG: hypothetical protein SYC29_05260 [Planctomycetota bacterium]|nr:hypothetical protein [Planctomycetota bacterium]
MARQSSITRWSVLALIVVLLGGAVTLLLGQLWLEQWARTGQRAAIGRDQTVDLPAGEMLVYYESNIAVPEVGSAKLAVRDPYGRRVRPTIPAEDNTFQMMLSDRCGRALWELNVVEPGEHTVRCFNVNFASDTDVPPGDRLVFGKQPGTVAQALVVRKTILIIGAGITLLLAAFLYIIHGVALQKRRAAEPDRSFPAPGAPAAPAPPPPD